MTDKLYFGATTACHLNQQPNTFMRINYLKKLGALMCLGLALLAGARQGHAQISVDPAGSGVLAFPSLPVLSNGWSSLSVGAAAGTFTVPGSLDDSVIANTLASAVNQPLGQSPTLPPSQNALARWNSGGLYLQTRPTGNDYTLLMATIKNNTGSNITHVTINYDWDQKNANPVAEEIPGHRAFYSLTGQPNTWFPIGSFSTFTTTSTAQPLAATLSLGTWTNGALLYVLWADDNGSGGTADPMEGGYTLDNFQVRAVPFTNVVIVTHPQSTSVSPSGNVTLSVLANGAAPIYYQWLKNSNIIANATNSTFSINNAQVSDQGFYSVVVSNGYNSVTSSNAFVTVSCSTPASITAQPSGNAALFSGDTLSLSVGVNGTAPIRYQWYRNNVIIPNATNATYTKVSAQNVDSGNYYVAVTNCANGLLSQEVIVSVGDAPYALLGLTNAFWKFNQTGTDLGATWKDPGYGDGTWSSGRGVLAFENNAVINPLTNTVLNLSNGPTAILTYYFRSSFILTNDPFKVSVVSSNFIDDGMVVYINGTEAFRYNMPSGPVGYSTLASAANPLGEGIPIASNIPPQLLVQGSNNIAVEVHQNAAGSSDIVFGMELKVISPAPTALTITNQPQDTIAQQGASATFTVGVAGEGAAFQWYRENAGIVTAIPGANLETYTIPATTPGDAGNYFVAVTNYITPTLYSRLASLTLAADTNAPTLVDADGTVSNTLVKVTFSEVVNPATATNTSNYRITNTLTGVTLSISSVVLTNGTNVTLFTGARTAGHNYILVVNNVQDFRTNTIATNSSIPIAAARVTLVGYNSGYRFYDPIPFFGDNPDIGTNWVNLSYNDVTAMWGRVSPFTLYPSIFYFGPDDGNAPGSVGWHLEQSDSYISYFRAKFNVDFSPGNVQLYLSHAIDDGAVFYLNGSDVRRVNVPDGPIPYRDPITFNTRASSTVGAIVRTDPVLLESGGVVPGTNLLAVSLHQRILLDLEKAYGAQLDARVLSYITGAVMITSGVADRTVLENQPVTFEATTVAGATFQWQQNNANIGGAVASKYTIQQVPLSLNNAQFRVVVSNGTSTATSSNGTLRVIADTVAPSILSATLASATRTVQIMFSEPVTSASATTIGNYVITNSAGQSQLITNATIMNGTNVTLGLSAISGFGLRLVVNNVRDISAAANVIPTTVVILGVDDQVISTAGTWRYLLVNTNQNIQTNYYKTTFDDSGWAGPSPAVLSVEPDNNLPAGWVKGTELAMFEIVGNVTNYFNTHYFRKTIPTSLVSGTVRLRGRVLYDDGVVIYVNGVELTRINMPAGTITAASQASAGHENNASVPTFDIVVTNWLAANNIIAAEVHQNGTASSDVVFGLELSAVVDSQVVRLPVGVTITNQPQSRSVGTNANVSFSVGATGDSPITYQWFKGAVAIPQAVGATLVLKNVQASDAAFYRVRVSNPVNSVFSQTATLIITNAPTTCAPTAWTLFVDTNTLSSVRSGNSNIVVLTWTNPVTNGAPCNAVAQVVLQRALTLGSVYPVPANLWTNIYTNATGFVRVTNVVPNQYQAYYRLRVD